MKQSILKNLRQSRVISIILIVALSLTTAFETFAQRSMVMKSNKQLKTLVKKKASKKKRVFTIVPQDAEFPGGYEALIRYLNEQIRYPNVAIENQVSGCVKVGFVVERDGSITDVKVLCSADPSLDHEVVKVVKSMPRWLSGKRNGHAVRFDFVVTVAFLPYENLSKSIVVDVNRADGPPINMRAIIDTIVKDTLYKENIVLQMPMYYGGDSALRAYLYENVHKLDYSDVRLTIPCRISVGFDVESNGLINNIDIVHSADSVFNRKMAHILERMPKWKPGTLNGIPARLRCVADIDLYFNRKLNFAICCDIKLSDDYKQKIKGEMETIVNDTIYRFVDKMPKPRCDDDYLDCNAICPNGYGHFHEFGCIPPYLSHSVFVGFIIEHDGSLSDVKVTSSEDASLNQAALDVVKRMPRWIPGTEKGKVVRVRYQVPVNFFYK